jgi:hypothetical protein
MKLESRLSLVLVYVMHVDFLGNSDAQYFVSRIKCCFTSSFDEGRRFDGRQRDAVEFMTPVGWAAPDRRDFSPRVFSAASRTTALSV